MVWGSDGIDGQWGESLPKERGMVDRGGMEDSHLNFLKAKFY